MINLFHLHFYCKELETYESFFTKHLGFEILGRHSKNDGLLDDGVNWEEINRKEINLRLIELQKGGVNIVLMPGRFEKPKLEHFGLLLDEEAYERSLIIAKELKLTTRERPNRVFISSKLGFRIEIQKNENGKHRLNDKDFKVLELDEIEFTTEKPQEFKKLIWNLFGVESQDNSIKLDNGLIHLIEGKFSLLNFSMKGSFEKNWNFHQTDIPSALPLKH